MLIWFGCGQGIGQITGEVFPGLVDIPLKVSLPKDMGTQDSSGLGVIKAPPSPWLELCMAHRESQE